MGGKTEKDKLRTLRTTTTDFSQRIKIILIVRYMRIISSIIMTVDASLAGVSLAIRKEKKNPRRKVSQHFYPLCCLKYGSSRSGSSL